MHFPVITSLAITGAGEKVRESLCLYPVLLKYPELVFQEPPQRHDETSVVNQLSDALWHIRFNTANGDMGTSIEEMRL